MPTSRSSSSKVRCLPLTFSSCTIWLQGGVLTIAAKLLPYSV
jgi:hypothetical protein